jgi:predicted transposase/invertase (TIGR01784 family)
MEAYRSSELRYEDLYNFTSYAKQEGKIEGIIEGEERGIKRGIKRGISFRNHEIAQNMLNLNMSINDIVKVTGLASDEILKIKLGLVTTRFSKTPIDNK